MLKHGSMYEVAIIGGGPAGATCAALCSAAGKKVLLLERSVFPREKVCGDCLNPLAWGVLEQLGLRERVLACVHTQLTGVRFTGIAGETVRIPLPQNEFPELGLTRGRLDQLLLERARETGAEVHENCALTGVRFLGQKWQLRCESGDFEARELVAADGRNSTTLRLLGRMPPPVPDERVAVQTHFPCPPGLESEVGMRFVIQGYVGIAPVGGGMANLCLVSRPRDLQAIKRWALAEFGLPEGQTWRSIAPLRRSAVSPVSERLWLVGDTATVVEPFTGEGIAYALRTGALCAGALLADDPSAYLRDHATLYRGRLWVNHLARWACLHPEAGSRLVKIGKWFPAIFSALTSKVVAR